MTCDLETTGFLCLEKPRFTGLFIRTEFISSNPMGGVICWKSENPRIPGASVPTRIQSLLTLFRELSTFQTSID